MIGKLSGYVDGVSEDSFILDVHGVGYLIFCPLSTLQTLAKNTEPVSLYIETVVTEDRIALYGFLTPLEQTWFRLLRTVQGVGVRVALGLLSLFSPTTLYEIISQGQKETLHQAEGVGPKLAVRLITELKDRLLKTPSLKGEGSSHTSLKETLSLENSQHFSSIEKDTLSALENLGYRRATIIKALSSVKIHSPDLPLPELLKICLKELSQSSNTPSPSSSSSS